LDTRYCGDGHLCRYDSKGTSLPWAYIGLNHGLKVIANAEVDKILIEKPAGGRPVATGVVYKDQAGVAHQVRAARVIVACGTPGTPLLFYKSGYGPRELLGDKLVVENKNVGLHLDGDASSGVNAYFPEAITPETQGGTGYTWTTIKPRPWTELNVQMWAKELARNHYPHEAALRSFAPEFGWEHKEYMRTAVRRIGRIVNRIQFLPWEWRITPDGRFEKISMDEQRIDATIKEAAELSYAWYDKMAVKPLQIDRRLRKAATFRPGHTAGTARAGANRDVSVCNSDFDSHDVDHLLITSGASMPRTLFCHSAGPIFIGAAYAWRRILANHFSRGSSTKGFA
jgi:choline dehydrogenase-like flavoprotein